MRVSARELCARPHIPRRLRKRALFMHPLGCTHSLRYVSSNGFVTFKQNQPTGCCEGGTLPNTDEPKGIISAWWADLDPSVGGHVYYERIESSSTDDEDGTRLVIEFYRVPHANDPTALATFEIVLHRSSSEFEIRLADAPMDADATWHTIGWDSNGGSQGCQIDRTNTTGYANWTAFVSKNTNKCKHGSDSNDNEPWIGVIAILVVVAVCIAGIVWAIVACCCGGCAAIYLCCWTSPDPASRKPGPLLQKVCVFGCVFCVVELVVWPWKAASLYICA